jgi:surface protein
MKKLLFLKLLALVACLSSALSANAYDFSAVSNGEYLYYNITGSSTVEVTYWNIENNLISGDIIIPSTVTNPNTNRTYTVTAIGDSAFIKGYYTTSTFINSISIPSTVTRIGKSAFQDQRELTSLSLPSSITTIGDRAFFNMDGLTSLTIPYSVSSLGKYLLAYCGALTSVTFGTGVTEIPDYAVECCPKLASLTIGSNVTNIGYCAFYADSMLTEVVIPDKVTTIERYAFYNCRKLTKVTLGSSVTSIDYDAFAYCNQFVANGTTYYGGLTITCKCATPPTIQSTTFINGNNTQYTRSTVWVPTPHALDLYQAATYWSNFTNYRVTQQYDFNVNGIYYVITGSNTVKVVNKYGSQLTFNDGDFSYSGNVFIPATVTYDGTTYNVTAIGTAAFSEARQVNKNGPRNQGDLKKVIIGDNVTTIEGYAFYECTGLTSVTIGSGVTSIGENAFKGCTSLTSVISRRVTPPTIQSTTFDNSHYSTATLYVPSTTAVNNYKAATYWKNFTNITIFEAYVCYNSMTPNILTFYCDGLRSSRTYTNAYGYSTTYDLNTGSNVPAWNGLLNINYIVFDESFANARPTTTYSWFAGMPIGAISGLSNLNTENVTDMSYMFWGAILSSLDVSSFNTSKVTNMSYMFYNCQNLTDLDVSSFNTSKVTNMSYMFGYCYILPSLDLSGFNTAKVTNMEAMFINCFKATTIYAGSGWTTNAVTSSSYMFTNCTSLVGGKGTTYNSSYVDKAYAHIDGGTSNPGYFTDKNASQSGDVDGNGQVTIADVTALIDLLLGGVTSGNPAADVNGDGSISIADVTALIDMLLNH